MSHLPRCRWLLIGLAVTGCLGSDLPATVNVTGQVLLNGEPVEQAAVTFVPKKAGPLATAQTDKEGKFDLRSFGQGDGAVVGEYAVGVVKKKTLRVDLNMETRETKNVEVTPPGKLVPAKYGDPKSSGLTANVTADGENHFVLNLQE